MLDSLRQGAKSWVAKLLLGLLVLSFAIWGISGQMFTNTSGAVLTAGGTSVSPIEYRLAYDRRVNELSQTLGTRLTRSQAESFGIDEQVLQQLASGAVLDETARAMGLGVSQQRVATLTASDPAFRGVDGTFNRQQFEFVINRSGMNVEDYLRNRKQAATREQIIDAVASSVSAPDTFLRNLALYRGESRTVEYVHLPRSLVEPIEPPDEETLQTWFAERKDDYAAPEYRKISYIELTPESIADPSIVSDEQVREYYDSNADRYTTDERRSIEQLNFGSREDAVAARESLRSGATFADLVELQDKMLEDVSLGTLTRDEIADAKLAEAAFSLNEGQVSEVIDGTFGPVLLRVTEVVPQEVTPLEDVADEIRSELALEEANRLLLDIYNAYEDARAAGQSMEEAAQSERLTVQSVEVDRSGRQPDGTIVNDLPQSRKLLAEAFETEAGLENPPIDLGANGFLFYEVEEVVPARERELEEVREQVLEDWTEAEASAHLQELANKYEAELSDGRTLDEIAAELEQEKLVKRGLKRNSDDADLGAEGVAATFNVPMGGTGSFANPAGQGQFLFKVTEVFEPASVTADSLPEDVVARMSQGIENDLLDQLVSRLRDEHEVTVNRAVMQQALAF